MIYENESSNAILIDYYKGAFGPTIRINIRSLETLSQVRDVFLQLAADEVREVKFHEVELVKVMGMKALILKLVLESQECEKTLELVDTTPEGPVFYWSRSSRGWMICAGLLDGLIKHNRPGHQYLTEEDIDDAIVEVAFLEA